MRRRNAVFVALVVALAACGGSDAADATDEAGPSDAPAGSPPPVAAPPDSGAPAPDDPVAPDPADTASVDPTLAEAPVEGTTWVLTSVLEQPVPEGARSTLLLDRELERVTGGTGCNSFSGGYELTGTLLRFGALGMTRMACPEGLAQLEVDLVEAFRVTGSFRVRGDVLELVSEGGVVATYRAGG